MKHFFSFACAAVLAMGTAMAEGYEVAANIPLTVSVTPASSFNTTGEIPVDQITTAIGVAPASTNVITMSGTEYVTEPSTAGCGWFFKADGTPCGWGEDEVIYAKYEENKFIVGSDENAFKAGETVNFKFGFYNENKVAMMDVTLKFVNETVVYETTLPKLEMTVDNTYKAFPLEFDTTAVYNALGAVPTRADFRLVSGDEYDGTFSATSGFWLNKENEKVGYGENAYYFVEYTEGNTLSVGQMPGKCQVGDEFATKVAFVVGGKAAVLSLNIVVVAAPVVDYNEVYALPLTADVIINQTGTVAIDQQALETALDCTIDKATVVACNVDSTYVTSTTANNGFWYDKNGNVSAWGDSCSVYVEYHADKPAELTIGMYQGREVGDEYTVKFGFANEDKVAMYTITVNIVAAPVVEFQEVYTADLTISIPLNDKFIPTPLTFDTTAVVTALGCPMADVKVASVDAEGKYVVATTANNGFWYNKDGYPAEWGDNSSVFVEYQGEATLNVGMFTSGITAGDEYTVKFGFYNGEKVAMLTIKATITEVDAIESISVDAANATIYNLRGVAVDPANLPAGIYIANGKKFIVR